MVRGTLKAWAGALAIVCVLCGSAQAARVIPGPGEPGHDAAFADLATLYDRQFAAVNAPFSISLDAIIPSPADRALLDGFLHANPGGLDFETFTGKTAFDMVDHYEEFGDMGMFGGMAAAGDALRYALLRDGGGTPAEVAEARATVIEIAEMWHAYRAVSGPNAVIARGLVPIGVPGWDRVPLVPLDDGMGNPLPADKGIVRREDASGLYPQYQWHDDASRDQISGYAYALGILWDVIVDDPDVPAGLKDDLRDDALHVATKLMEVAPERGLDMMIRDADGRLTTYASLHPADFDGVVLPGPIQAANGFNALLGLGVMKVMAHVSGDKDVARFVRHELIDRRGWDGYLDSAGVAYIPGRQAREYNLNMAWVGIWNLMRYETDPGLLARWNEVLETVLWDPEPSTETNERFRRNTWHSFLYTGLRLGGTDPEAVANALVTLTGFPTPPTFNRAERNCDEAELAAGVCLAVDGVTEIVLHGDDFYRNVLCPPIFGYGACQAAVDVVPMHVRQTDNFLWRSSPYGVLGGLTDPAYLNPGGDFRGAYWLGRYLTVSADNAENRTQRAPVWPDEDADGVPYDRDNCLGLANPGQEDNDGDGLGNPCDPTPDGELCGSVPAGDAGASGALVTLAFAAFAWAARGRRGVRPGG